MRYRKPDNEEQARWRSDIESCRKYIGLSVEAMAKHLGIPAFRLDKIEKGVQPATEELARQANDLWEEFSEREHEEAQERSRRLDAMLSQEDDAPWCDGDPEPRQSLGDLFKDPE